MTTKHFSMRNDEETRDERVKPILPTVVEDDLAFERRRRDPAKRIHRNIHCNIHSKHHNAVVFIPHARASRDQETNKLERVLRWTRTRYGLQTGQPCTMQRDAR